MIRYTKALKLISENVFKSKTLETIKTDNSNNRILGRDYYSEVNLPKNNLSAMDGAIIYKKEKKLKLKIIGAKNFSVKLNKLLNYSEDKFVIFKGDGDQDRPNQL